MTPNSRLQMNQHRRPRKSLYYIHKFSTSITWLFWHMFTTHNNNGKHEVDHPDTKATNGLHMVLKHISVKIVRASCILSVKLFKGKTHSLDHCNWKKRFFFLSPVLEHILRGAGSIILLSAYLFFSRLLFILTTCIVQVHIPTTATFSTFRDHSFCALCKSLHGWFRRGHAPLA